MLRWSIVPGLVAVAVLVAWMDTENGIRAWQSKRADLAEARGRIDELRLEIEASQGRSETLEAGGFALEAAIREELGFARAGEIVVRLPALEGSAPPIP